MATRGPVPVFTSYLGVDLPPKLHEKLRERARIEKGTVAAVVRRILSEHFLNLSR
jgi:hypothetical protein